MGIGEGIGDGGLIASPRIYTRLIELRLRLLATPI